MIITFLKIIVLLGTAIFLGYLIFTTISFYRHKNRKTRDLEYPLVSILKPVKGFDQGLEENLKSFFELDYPSMEILFALETPEDPANIVIEKVASEYKHIRCKIRYTGTKKEKNPKIENLCALEKVASGKLLWIADANIRVEKGTLKKLAEEYLLKGSKMVFSPIRGGEAESLGSLIEGNYLNLYVSGNILGSWNIFRHQLTVGKSILLEKDTLTREFGGLKFFINYLAEDYMMGKHYKDRKLGIATNGVWIKNINPRGSIKDFRNRVIRWSVMRHKINRTAAIIEVLAMNPLLLSLLLFVLKLINFEFLFFIWAVKSGTEVLSYILMNRGKPIKALAIPLATVIKDLILFEAALRPFFTGSVNWRGRKIKIERNSVIECSPSGVE